MNLIKDLWGWIKEWNDWHMKDWIKAGIIVVVVLFILCSAGAIPWENFYALLWMGWMFKVFVALIDTPIIYFCIWLLRDKIQPVDHLEEN